MRGSLSPHTFLRLFAHLQMMPALESGEETLVGGQAVLEGVMMRAPHSYCVAVRRPDGELVTERLPVERMSERHKIFKYPVMRGLGTLCQAMVLGAKALKFSASAALEGADGAVKSKPAAADKAKKELPGWAFAGPLIFSLAFFLFTYKFIPLFLATQLAGIWPAVS